MDPTTTPAGILVVAVWPDGPDGELRARLTSTLNITRRQHVAGVVDGVSDIVDTIEEWLRWFQASRPDLTEADRPAPSDL